MKKAYALFFLLAWSSQSFSTSKDSLLNKQKESSTISKHALESKLPIARTEYICGGKSYNKVQLEAEYGTSLCNKVLIHSPNGKAIELPNSKLTYIKTIVSNVFENFATSYWANNDGASAGFVIDLYGANKIYRVGSSDPVWSSNKVRFFIFDEKEDSVCENLSVFSLKDRELIFELNITTKDCLVTCQAKQCLINISEGDMARIKWKDSMLVGTLRTKNKIQNVDEYSPIQIAYDAKKEWTPSFKVDGKHWREIYKKNLQQSSGK